MNGKDRHGRRYSLRITGMAGLHDPAALNEIGAYNPGNLHKECRKVAQHASTALGTEITMVKHLAAGERDDRVLWPERL